MLFIILIINSLYFVFNLILIAVWREMMAKFKILSHDTNTKLTVIIPVRNEEKYILQLLKNLNEQSYPADNFEVIVANDDSTDNTESIVLNYQEEAKYSLKILNLLNDASTSPKKRAIQKSIEISSGELLITTDGDCSISPNWLISIQQLYKNKDAKLISSPVTFTEKDSLWNTIQIIEFASLIGSGACSMYLKKPNMCNGANLAYTREVFEEVNGFAGNENVASGDDEFLMHKIAKKYPDKVFFNPEFDAIVRTASQENLTHFYQQRRRWASKWKQYDNWQVSALAVFIFLANLSVLVAYCMLDNYFGKGILLLKFSAEFYFLYAVIRFLGYQSKAKYIPIVQLIYPFYVVFFGLLAQGKGYRWKGRSLE